MNYNEKNINKLKTETIKDLFNNDYKYIINNNSYEINNLNSSNEDSYDQVYDNYITSINQLTNKKELLYLLDLTNKTEEYEISIKIIEVYLHKFTTPSIVDIQQIDLPIKNIVKLKQQSIIKIMKLINELNIISYSEDNAKDNNDNVSNINEILDILNNKLKIIKSDNNNTYKKMMSLIDLVLQKNNSFNKENKIIEIYFYKLKGDITKFLQYAEINSNNKSMIIEESESLYKKCLDIYSEYYELLNISETIETQNEIILLVKLEIILELFDIYFNINKEDLKAINILEEVVIHSEFKQYYAKKIYFNNPNLNNLLDYFKKKYDMLLKNTS